jgi:hypothetical protein
MVKRNVSGGARPGGGLKSRVVVEKPVKVGKPREEINPRAVSQIGSALGNKATDHAGKLKGSAEKLVGSKRPLPSRLGNEVAASTICGVGGSRAVSKSGSQQQWGPAAPGNPRPSGGDILSEFGLERGRGR